MARGKKKVTISFAALTVEGALIAPAMLAKITLREAGGQIEADYKVPKGLTIRDEIARYFRIGQAQYKALASASMPSTSAAVRFTEDLLRDVFGFNDLQRPGTREIDGHNYAVTLEGLGGRVPVIVVPPSDDLDRASDHLPGDGRRRSAASAIQDWLNANDDALWGLCCNGEKLRLMRDNASLTRPAYFEADLRQMFEGEGFADFATLWLLLHASRFGTVSSPAADCALERWREAGAKEGLAARDRLRDGVESALLSLGQGFLADNPTLREKLQKGELPMPEFFSQLLRLVYRLIFLLVAEERGLLHTPSAPVTALKLYAEGYSLLNLRARAIRRAAWDRHHDRWEGLLVSFEALSRGEPMLGLPALGGLFLAEQIPELLASRLSNRALMEAIFRLAWLKDDSSLVAVNWRDMETEELGSVYESLLELTPRLTEDGHNFAFAEGAETKGNTRKTTGSYYTPDSLVQALLDSALDPVLDQVEAEAENVAVALLRVTVIDPACGSGHFLLAAARRIATRLARARAGGVASAEDFRHALRDVARNCIHGVDRNPMAVELTKVALWIETVEPGKPLGFLDANVRCGDTLLGLFDLDVLSHGIPDEAYKPLSGDDKDTAKYFATRNKAEKKGQGELDFSGGSGKLPAPPPLSEAMRSFRALPEDSTEDIAEKKRRFAVAQADPRRWAWRIAADLYVAAFLTPKTGGVPANRNTVTIPTTGHVWQALTGPSSYGPLIGRAQDLVGEARAFHWPLEFADVMGAGGFDVVLGNPPWERIKLQEQEFFAAREPEIAEAPNAAARGRMIEKLKTAEQGTRDRALFEEFEMARRMAEAASVFARVPGDEGGRFALTGKGDVNTYALFAELFANLTSPKGRAGVIVPTGIATDLTTATFFAALVEGNHLLQLASFENEEFIFPGIHHSFRFCLLVVAKNAASIQPEFCFFLRRVNQRNETERRFSLSAADIARINPNTRTAPIFRSRADSTLTMKMYSQVPILLNDSLGIERGQAGNLWNLEVHTRIWHMAEDSAWFRTAEQLLAAGYVRDGADWILSREARAAQSFSRPENKRESGDLRLQPVHSRTETRYVPLYEARMIHQFDHRWATYDNIDIRDVLLSEKQDTGFEPTTRYWVPKNEVDNRLTAMGWNRGWLMGWRDITSAHVLRTVIATVFPSVGSNNKVPLMFVDHSAVLVVALLGNFLSLALDYVARQKIGGTSLTFFYLKQLPILAPQFYSDADLSFIVPRVLALVYSSQSMAPFARDLGYQGPPFAWDEDRRAILRAELDAFYARAYGLTRDELRYILDPADMKGPDYPSETFRVLKNNDIKRHGEYRTARLVLEAWDKLERGELS